MTTIRDTLFGDLPLEQWPEQASSDYPWSAFSAARTDLAQGKTKAAVARWQEISVHPGLDARHYLQAWHFLRQHNHEPPADMAKQVLGVVVEVGMSQGVDLLAAYAERSARYYNFSGGGVVWEQPDASLDAAIDRLLDAGAAVVGHIGPWLEERLPPPDEGMVRLNFLTPSGLHFGQAPMSAFQNDPLAGPVLQAALVLLKALTARGQ